MHFDQIKRRDFITFLGGVNWKKIALRAARRVGLVAPTRESLS